MCVSGHACVQLYSVFVCVSVCMHTCTYILEYQAAWPSGWSISLLIERL